MDLRELGVQLKERREALGLSLDEVIQRTKISRRNISAIEEGNRDDLPHPVYSKGFIKNYARLLSMDMDEVERILTLEFAESEESQAAAEEALDDLKRDIRLHADAARNKKKKSLGLAVFVGLLLVAAIGIGVWLLPSLLPVETPVPAPNAAIVTPGNSDADMVAPSLNSVETGNGASVDTPSDHNMLQDEVPAVPEETKDDVVEEQTADSNVMEEAPEETSKQARSVTESQHNVATEHGLTSPAANHVTIHAREKCWLQAIADDAHTREVFLQPGDQVVLNFDKSMVVKLGNGGGVDVTYDGKPIETGVPSGSVKTLTFP